MVPPSKTTDISSTASPLIVGPIKAKTLLIIVKIRMPISRHLKAHRYLPNLNKTYYKSFGL